MFFEAEPIIFEYAKKLRNNPTKAEQYLWNYLNKNQLGIKFRRQHPISKYITDFYCHKLRLVIEIDGDYHTDAEQMKYDRFRSNELEEFEIKVIRFSNKQVLNDVEFVLEQLKDEISFLQ